MYESCIEVVTRSVPSKIEGEILNKIVEIGVNVDKDELIKALQYDRDQYDKGYEDGQSDAEEEIKRLERICNSYALQYGSVRDQLPIIQRVGVDAASRIFEEIGALMKAHSIGDIDDHTLYCYIHALRQKYTGGKE
jgi:hypothetical protein